MSTGHEPVSCCVNLPRSQPVHRGLNLWLSSLVVSSFHSLDLLCPLLNLTKNQPCSESKKTPSQKARCGMYDKQRMSVFLRDVPALVTAAVAKASLAAAELVVMALYQYWLQRHGAQWLWLQLEHWSLKSRCLQRCWPTRHWRQQYCQQRQHYSQRCLSTPHSWYRSWPRQRCQ